MTLDGLNQVDPEWIFQLGSSLLTATGAQVLAINGANSNNIFFQVGTSATLSTGTMFQGNILADQSITADTGSGVTGRLLAINAAVTLGTNSRVVVPEPSSMLMLSLSVLSMVGYRRRSKC